MRAPSRKNSSRSSITSEPAGGSTIFGVYWAQGTSKPRETPMYFSHSTK